MQATAKTVLLVGLDGHIVSVEADVSPGPSSLEIVGLSDGAARETRIRVRAALQQICVDVLEHRVVVNVALGGVRPTIAGAFDLPVAVAVLAAMGKVPAAALEGVVILGELALTGAPRPVRGVLPALRAAAALGVTRALIPRANAAEAAGVTGIEVGLVEHLSEVVRHLRDGNPLASPGARPPFTPSFGPDGFDMADIRGHAGARRAMEIAAAGGHDILLIGEVGKVTLARRLVTILPPMTIEEALDVTAISSVSGLLPERGHLITARPFRAPHHTVSAAGLVGGGSPVRPGEVSIAHGGVLLLDDLPEFKRAVLDALRQPLEEGVASVVQSGARFTYPARPLLVGAMAPCPYDHGSPSCCDCTPEATKRYRGRVPAHLMARFGVHVELPTVDAGELQRAPRGEPSEAVRARVIAAREVQADRARRLGVSATNGELRPRDMERVATPDQAGARTLSAAIERLGLSASAYGQVLRVGRTIADLDGSDVVLAPHVAEAVHARVLDRAQ